MKAHMPHRFIQNLQQYNIDILLYNLWRLSADCFLQSNTNKLRGTLFAKIKQPGTFVNHNVIVQSWALVDIAYCAVKYCPKTSGKTTIPDNELLYIINLHTSYLDDTQGNYKFMRQKNPTSDFFLYLYGFFGEQVRFQTFGNSLDNFNREMFILNSIAPSFDDPIEIETIVKKTLGFTCEELATLLYYLLFLSTKTAYPLEYPVKNNRLINENNIATLVQYYSHSLDDICKNKLGRQSFYSKPIIRTQGRFLFSNTYLLLFLFESAVHWVVRDYYNQKNSQTFVNAFGVYFEKYVELLLESYLPQKTYRKIPETKIKQADWEICVNGFSILIEQKSALIGLAAKQQDSDIATAKNYINRHWIKAINQLDSTEQSLNKGKHIKIILTYENYYKSELLDEIFTWDECTIEDDGYYWLVSIHELEMLLHTFYNSVDVFNAIIENKTLLETTKSHDGRELIRIMENNGIDQNYHISQDEYSKYLTKIKENFKTELISQEE